MEMKLAPSVMCCDFINLRKDLDIFERQGIELLHVDIMDGNFVPNFTLGVDFIKQLKKATNIPLDIHLMVEQPERTLDAFPFGEGDWVSIHVESTKHLQRVLAKVKEKGAHPIVALNPATPLCMIEDVMDDIDGVLIMSVNPGFAGQKLVPHAIDKIAETKKLLAKYGREDVEIEVDGNVNPANAIRMKNAGANIFVVGTSGIFFGDMEANIQSFRKEVFGG
ncbi:MAG: ribulose-phosphate 3-epimerase [Clostridia bacterium]|nr:ribulose-phosphate 3-epimerase [Clostridia bacterium]